MDIKIPFSILTLCVALLGCNDNSKKSDSSHSSQPSESSFLQKLDGVWLAEGYGEAYDIKANDLGVEVDLYQLTSATCLYDETLSFQREELSFVSLSSVGDLMVVSEPGQMLTPGIEFKKVDALPEVCIENLHPTQAMGEYEFDAQADFDLFWHTFNELYIGFDLSEVDWVAQRVNAERLIPYIETEAQLFELLAESITPLMDFHNVLFLYPESDEQALYYVTRKPTIYDQLFEEYVALNQLQEPYDPGALIEAETYIDDQISLMEDTILSYAQTGAEFNLEGNGQIQWFQLENNIAYLRILGMSEYTEENELEEESALASDIIERVLTDFIDTDGLIIDVRLNSGGYDEVSMAFLARFLDQERHLYTKKAKYNGGVVQEREVYLEPQPESSYVKPIKLLTSANTYSAGELFVLAMAELPQVEIIGEATAGGFSDMLSKRLGADIIFTLSNEIYTSPAGDWYEGVGVPVDIQVPYATQEQREMQVDEGIETAIQRLLH